MSLQAQDQGQIMLQSARTTPIEVVKHTNKGKKRFLSTRKNANEVHKQKIKGKLCCKAQEQRQMRLLRTRKRVNDIAKHKNKGESD